MDLGTLPVIDWEQSMKLTGNKRELAEEILHLLIRDLPNESTSIYQAYQTKNFPEMLRLVHKLHGALCYCGLPRLKTLIGRLETELKSNIMDSLPSLTEQLNEEVTVLLERYSRLYP